MKKVLQGAMFLALSFLAVSCGSDDGISDNSILVENTNFDVSETVNADVFIHEDENTDTAGLNQIGLKVYGVDTNDFVFFDLYTATVGDLEEGDYVYGGTTSLNAFEYSSASVFVINGLTYSPTVGTFKVHEVATGLYSVSFEGKDVNGTNLEFDFDGTVSYNGDVCENSILVADTKFNVSSTVTSDVYIYGDQNISTITNTNLYQLGLKVYGVDSSDFVSFDLYAASEEDLLEGDYTYGGSTLLNSFEYSSASIFVVNGITYFPTNGTFSVHEVATGFYSVSFEGEDVNGTDLEFDFEGIVSYNDLRPMAVPGEVDGTASVNSTVYTLVTGVAADYSNQFSSDGTIYNYDLILAGENGGEVYIEGFSATPGFLSEGIYNYDGSDDEGDFTFGSLSSFTFEGSTYDLTGGSFTVNESTTDHFYNISFSGTDDAGNVLTMNFEGTLIYQDFTGNSARSSAKAATAKTKFKAAK